ncbi:sterol desaturase family protein [Nocardioides sp.]|uniref:sterol desaturase family protein n=1 Tax=Nocardioides sp. TaxID=35761 RepID=UPI001A2A8048|nr:sterol desaturase family protein [Nocardioides sp.]MBJ7358742.1 sterol desaturase family protein [Nocardioides sp.]
MVDLVIYAIPLFFVCLALEAASFRYLPDDDERGYEMRDSLTSLSMGLGNVFTDGAMKLVALAVFAAAYTVSPFQLSADTWWVWVALFFADDLLYYLFHRAHHEVRVLWASHVVHHSSQFFNLSTALRQPWTPMSIYPFWLPMAFFFPPWMILFQQSVSLIYQFFLHTERIGTLWRPVELVMNTPSHHRVHHGSNDVYLDRNYGGILIIWDRLFGSFEPEGERVTYGLTRNIETYHPVTVAFHEFRDLWRDLRRADSWRTRFNHLLRGPEWTPDGRPSTTGHA